MMNSKNLQTAARKIPVITMSMFDPLFRLQIPPNLFDDIPPCAFGRSLDWAGSPNYERPAYPERDGHIPRSH